MSETLRKAAVDVLTELDIIRAHWQATNGRLVVHIDTHEALRDALDDDTEKWMSPFRWRGADGKHLERGCECADYPRCHPHSAQEFGGGEPDKCDPHAHTLATPSLDVDRLARALDDPGVFEDELGPERAQDLAEAIARAYADDTTEAP